MPERSPTKDRHSRRNVSRGRKVSGTKTDVNGVQRKDSEKIAYADISIEARAVEAILAGRPSHKNNSSWGMWVSIVVLEVIAFVWFKWALEVYSAYRIGHQ